MCRVFISVVNLHVLDRRVLHIYIIEVGQACVCVGGGGGIEIHFRESRDAKLFDYDR